MIRFLHGFDELTVPAEHARRTVLEYLREDLQCTGTKEGCASGDCGACTAVVARKQGSTLNYQPLNTCIATLGSLHGAQLITVEQLENGSTWHPVQRAMIENHASQCGFCTPGFVMSLFALYHQSDEPDRHQILEALGGNLCRCTGYRPIIDAALLALSSRESDQFKEHEAVTLAALKDIHDDSAAPSASQSGYVLAESVEQVGEALANDPGAQIIAGGTDLMLERTQQLRELPTLIDISQVPALGTVDADDSVLRVGAAVTHREFQSLALSQYPELAELIERFGSLQIRSKGTVVGNIANASPIGDWPPVFLALNATLTLRSQGSARDIGIDDFFLGYKETALAPDEFVEALSVPTRPEALFLRAYKISKRFEDDISAVCGVFALTVNDNVVTAARIAMGGMDAIPRRAKEAEEAIVGLNLTDDKLPASVDLKAEFHPISDARASADYRSEVMANLLNRLQAEYRGELTRANDSDIAGGVIAHG